MQRRPQIIFSSLGSALPNQGGCVKVSPLKNRALAAQDLQNCLILRDAVQNICPS